MCNRGLSSIDIDTSDTNNANAVQITDNNSFFE